MVIINMSFFDYKHVMYQHAVNDEYYVLVFKNLEQQTSRKPHGLVGNWILHHDNARRHVATSVQK